MREKSPVHATDSSNDIAIVGMGCVFPGAKDVQSYWENIVNKVDAIGEPPPEWEAELYYDPDHPADDKIYCKRGGFLGELAAFDPLKYGVMPKSVDGTEPDHFLALRVAHQALMDAGDIDEKVPRERTEVIIGRGSYVNRGNTTAIQHGIVVDQVLRILKQLHPEHSDEELLAIRKVLKASLPPFNAETAPGLVPNIISGRIANRLDLMGANYIIDAACASSLLAVDLGMRDLLSGRCDLAVVGGVHASTPPPIIMIFCQLQAISKTGELRPFDRRANGTLLGEGAGMVVLKRREDAERDGDNIYALIKGIGSASDGRALGLLAPRVEGEELALKRAYEAAACSPESVGLLEAHGTGTPTGDEVEIDALKRVFGTRSAGQTRCALGSVKSMISHLMPASGIAGLIKTALALHHKVLPPTLHCEEPNASLVLDDSAFYLNTETRPWIHPHGKTPRRAGVNAFGFGGINAHAVLEEYAGPGAVQPSTLHHTWDSELFIFSGETREELVEQGECLRQTLKTREFAARDLAYTLNVGQELKSLRLAIVAADTAELDKKLANALGRLGKEGCRRIADVSGIYFFSQPLAKEGKLAFVFPGEGSQYTNMLSDLCIHFPEVRHFFDFMDGAFVDHLRGYLPSQGVFPPPLGDGQDSRSDELWNMDTGAEAVFAASQALFALLHKLEIRPDAMVGHSTGEHSALLASGALELSSSEQLKQYVLAVNSIFEGLNTSGTIPDAVLLAVGGADLGFLRSMVSNSNGELFIAMDNCPHQVVLCGKEPVISTTLAELESHGAICQRLPFQRAYHTPWFEVFSKPLSDFFESVDMVVPEIPLYSCVTAQRSSMDVSELRALAARSWSAPVLFRETMEQMYDDGIRLFVEVGPRANLKGFIDDTLRGKAHAAIASNVSHRSGIAQLNHMVGQLVAHGVPVRLEHLYERRAPEFVELREQVAEPVAGKSAMPGMLIATGLQPLRLPPDFSLDTAPDRNPAIQPSSTLSPQPTALQQVKVQRVKVDLEKVGQGVQDAAAQPALRVTQRSTGTARSVHVSAMREHFQTMGKLLEVQEQVMRSYVRSRVSRSSRPMPSPAPVPPASSGTSEEALNLPFVGEIMELVPGQRAKVRRTLQIKHDIFLADHTLGRDVSVDDPDLLALPVVPLTMSMEILAQGGALLKPGKVLTGMQDVRGYKWITLEDHELTLEIEARSVQALGSEDAVHVCVRELGKQPASEDALLIEGNLIFQDAYPGTLAVSPFTLQEECPSHWSPQRLYRDWMFHGPCFRGVKSMDRSGADGASATLEVLPRTDLFHKLDEPGFLTDPVLLDAAGQVVAFWAVERLQSGFDIFPYTLKQLQVFAAPQRTGTRVECRVRTQLIGDRQMRSDLDLVDSGGRLLYRMIGWEDWRFDMPSEFLKLRMAPREAELGQQWNSAIAQVPVTHTLACSRLLGFSSEFLDAHGAIWRKVLAHLILSREERLLWSTESGSADGGKRWLLLRAAAKDVVRRLVQQELGVQLCPADIEIMPDQKGLLVARGAWSDQLGGWPTICCTEHGGVFAAVAMRPNGAAIGFEMTRFDPSGLAELSREQQLSAVEQKLLERADESAHTQWKMRIRCAREAAAKVLGKDAKSVLSEMRLLEINLDSGSIRMKLADPWPQPYQQPGSREIVVYTACDGCFVCAVTVMEEGNMQ